MHWLVTGITGCGKSRIMREVIIPAHRRAGRWVGVLDPLGGIWPANWTTTDPLAFVAAAKNSSRCVWVVDEYAQFTADYKTMKALEWIFTVGRNRGHLAYALAQRLMMIPPNVRNQCSHAVVFNQQSTDLEDLAGLMNQPGIRAAATFPAGKALLVEPFTEPRPVVLFANVKRNHAHARPQPTRRPAMPATAPPTAAPPPGISP